MIELAKLSEQKNHRANKIQKRNLKPTHDEELAKTLTPMSKEGAEINESTKKLV